MQMNERDLIKKNLQERELVEDKYLTDKAIQEFDEKERLKRDHMSRIQNENLKALQYQIGERKRRLMNEDRMNINEANLNNYIGVRKSKKNKKFI